MTSRSCLKIFFWLVIAVGVQAIKRMGYVNRPFGRHNRQAGRYMSLSSSGVEKIQSAGLLFLNQQLVSSTRTIQWQYDTSPGGIQGFFQVAQIQPTGYMAPQFSYISFASPNKAIFTMENAGIAITGRFFGNHAPPPFGELPAQITGQITGVSIALLTQFNLNSNYGLDLVKYRPANCSALVKNVQFSMEPDGQYAWYVKAFEQDQVRHLVGEMNHLFQQRFGDHLCNHLLKSLEFPNPLRELKVEQLVEPLNNYRMPGKFIVWNGVIVSNQTDLRI
uniref:Uncharacterized protein n=1 Tax=Ditylenchus dipsaci TaxID=166011 RepID=A0A915E210_9BILA